MHYIPHKMEGDLSHKSFLLVFLIVLTLQAFAVHGTSVGFYSKSCPSIESIVKSTVASHVKTDFEYAAGLLRLHFHDCFVRGCDASILIAGNGTEKQAPPNRSLKGYEVIDEAKAKLEAQCPGVVSCADILALAARDSVVLSGGLSWQVPTGRRDGRVSIENESFSLPGPNDSVAVQKKKFSDLGLNVQELVTLAGGHTIGTAGCRNVADRIYNTNGTDPSIDPSFLRTLRSLCPQDQPSKRLAIDTGSQAKFDTSYYANLKKGHGVLRSDQVLWTDPSTRAIVQKYLAATGCGPGSFNVEFGKAMVKMSNIGIKTGANGEIRKKCSAIN
ncbi:cationic peroxidase 2-like [Lotus japonicus]|uniref:Peroxidase n=1 Tax=Lotus japonicus TaxID=34305 RepID=I3T8F2_LOTJA|nr:cationic peroxidase 2-like [Lotus japonicus]AFK48794.1 unknown [Lotus japonicus]